MLLLCLQLCVLICNVDDKESKKRKVINVEEQEKQGGGEEGPSQEW